MDRREEFEKRYSKFEDRYDLVAASYQTHDGHGNAGPWVANFVVIEKTSGPESPAHTFADTAKKYDSEEQANAVALWLGLRWLEENANRHPVA
jgi:hypothetical protein